MDDFSGQLNILLVDTFRSILKVEEQIINNTKSMDLSISELHLIEAVGKNGNSKKTISEVAKDLDITLSSVTIGINKLVKKGYVEKAKVENDGRCVNVFLKKEGLKMDSAHKFFHKNMIRAVAMELSEEEKQAMIKGINKLNKFFVNKLETVEEK